MRIEKDPAGRLFANSIEIEGYQDSFYTAVLVTTGAGEVLGRGTARRSPEDKNRPEIAQQLALGRALEAAGKKIIRVGNGLVKHQDDVAAEKRQRAEMKAAPKRRTRKTK